MLCINDDLPEVRHLGPDSGARERRYRWDALRKVMLGAGGSGSCASSWTFNCRQDTRQSVCGIGYRLPGPLVRAGHLHGIEQVDGVHDNPI